MSKVYQLNAHSGMPWAVEAYMPLWTNEKRGHECGVLKGKSKKQFMGN